MIQQITSSSENIFKDQFRNNLLKQFSRTDIINLSSHENPKVAFYFFKILLVKYPQECFKVLMKNLDNKKTLVISTSYDTMNEMTVPEAMMFEESKKSIFTKEQKKELFESILTHIETRSYLEGYVFIYLLEHQNHPDPKYYPYVKKLLTRNASDFYFDNMALLDYFANYKKPQDSLIIKDFLKKNIFEKGAIHMNISVEYIKNHPKPSYFPILEEFYDKRVKGKVYRADDIFFEFEDLTKATIQYKTERAKELIKKITYDTKYKSSGNFLASNEQIYILLKDNDKSNYFAEITNDLKHKVNKVKMDTIINWNNRWNYPPYNSSKAK
ncbi:hypothetical protein [Chryseobacterium sp. LAM-KRS1]|uniref:hypothetical protein n=1 Tax=Chryseobacterium sp. LAM-KRS1 TaxID=2715754 RepID=UPI0015554E0B|nr:hypothetical protein [Chryseobacterium sp. LAM-KRS1]